MAPRRIPAIGAATLAAALLMPAACSGPSLSIPVASCAVTRLSDVPVTLAGRLPMVQAKLGGIDATMVLDTGADSLLLNESAIGRLGIEADRRRAGLSHGLNGTAVSYAASVDRLVLGTVDLGRREASVIPFRWPRPGPPPDGFLAGSILFIFDLDIDIPNRNVTLYMPRDCPGGAPPWGTPFTTLQAQPTVAGHAQMAVPVTLDGHDIMATVDTGAEISVVTPRVAALAGVSGADLLRDGTITAQGFGPASATARLHRFGELAIAGEVFPGPTVAIADIPAGAGDMLLGEDWLRTHRVWLSYASKRIYVAPAQGPPAAAR